MKLIVASNNKKKIIEMSRILKSLDIEVMSLKEAGIDIEIEETGTTFSENAYIKAKAIYDMTKRPCIADDSGLEVDYLKGAPGVYTARYAGEHATDQENIDKLLGTMEGVKDRGAQFVSAICCVINDEESIATVGSCEGTIGYEMRGENGFGYDPIFMVGDRSFAQLSEEEKDAISHRGKAMRAFYHEMKSYMEKQL